LLQLVPFVGATGGFEEDRVYVELQVPPVASRLGEIFGGRAGYELEGCALPVQQVVNLLGDLLQDDLLDLLEFLFQRLKHAGCVLHAGFCLGRGLSCLLDVLSDSVGCFRQLRDRMRDLLCLQDLTR